MEFNRNKTTVEEIREIKFGGTYFGDNCSGVNRKFKKVQKFMERIYCTKKY